MPSFTIFRTGDHRAVDMRGYFGGSKWMCQQLAEDNGGAVQEVGEVPWVTPVFGSGSLSTAGSLFLDVDDIYAQISDHVSRLPAPPRRSESWETIAERFARSLISTRCPSEPGREGTPVKIEVDERSALLILVTALATRFCHAARSVSPEALSRSSDERVQIDLENWSALDDPYELVTTVVEPLLGSNDAPGFVSRLLDLIGGDQEMQPLATLLGAVAAGLSPQTIVPSRRGAGISLNSMRLLTEATWLQLVRSQDVYYGWSELLVDLLLTVDGMVVSDGAGTSPTFARRPHQAAQMSDVDRIEAAFENATNESWDGDEQSQIHRSVATMLGEQARWSAKHAPTTLVSETGQSTHPIPRSIAISVSFDLELEMALVRQGQSYQVAVPFYAVKGSTRDADLIWTCATVADPVGLDDVKAPTGWFPLTRENKRLLDPGLPLIIRATGCPLLKISPELVDQVRTLLTGNPAYSFQMHDLSGLWVQHAVTVDEYLALRQAEVEIYQAVESRSDTKPRVTDISLAFEHGRSRNDIYFTFLGVPFADPAVRQRLLTLLTTRWVGNIGEETGGRPSPQRPVPDDPGEELSAEEVVRLRKLAREQRRAEKFAGRIEEATAPRKGPEDPSEPSDPAPGATDPFEDRQEEPVVELPAAVKGLAVNSRLDPDEVALLASLGLQVVHGQCDDLARHLDDYAAHLGDGTFSALYRDRCFVSGTATTTSSKVNR